jgi:ComF family protein
VLREALEALLSVLLPAPCRLCDKPLLASGTLPICSACLEALPRMPAPICEQCGRLFHTFQPAEGGRQACQLCRRGVYAFDVARSFGVYDDLMVRAVVLLKYHSLKPLGAWFGRQLEQCVASEPEAFAADVVVPVPLHPSRLRERGYNQAELIARPLARRLHLPLRPYLLARTRPRPEKLKLTRRERWLTVRGAYAMRGAGRIDNLRVLLVDDVFTTGATLDACARALKQAGAARVACLTVARVVSAWVSPRGADSEERQPGSEHQRSHEPDSQERPASAPPVQRGLP